METGDGAKVPDPAAFLEAAGWPAPRAATRVTGGWDTLMWRFVAPDGGTHALRVYRPGPGRDPGRVARREAAALRAAGAGGLPAPAVEAEGTLGDHPFMIQSWMTGTPMLDGIERRPWQLWTLGARFGRLQARLHRVPPPDEIRASSPTAWTRHISDEAFADAVRRRAGATAFCHFDYHPLNVLVRSGRLSAILDFVNATAADPRADLAITRTLLLAAPLPPDVPPALRPFMGAARRLLAAAWRRGYRLEAGRFAVEPLFEAWGAAYYLRGVEEAVRDGRGWATAADVQALRRYIAARADEAGVRTARS